MYWFYRKSKASVISLAAIVAAWTSIAVAQTAEPAPKPHSLEAANSIRERINAWTIGLAAGLPEGAPLRFAGELARVLDDGDEMRVMPLITRGTAENINNLLYLRGVDAAIVYGDTLAELNDQPEVRRKVNFIANLFPAEIHIVARPEIKTLADLNGKTVNFNTKGSPGAYTGPIIFDRLQLRPNKIFIPNPVAMKKMMERGDISAIVFISSKPLDAFIGKNLPAGFHFLSIPYSPKLGEYYLPSSLTNTDYPDLIPANEQIMTVAVPVVLAAFDWNKGSESYRKMERFVKYFFTKLPILQTQPGYHLKWKDVNLAGTVPGWNRFPPAQTELDKAKRTRAETAKIDSSTEDQQDKLFQEFEQWRRKHNK